MSIDVHLSYFRFMRIIPLKQRVRRLFGQSQDDSSITNVSHMSTTGATGVTSCMRRWGSCESGFCSVSTDEWLLDTNIVSNRSIGSSLLTVSDLEVN